MRTCSIDGCGKKHLSRGWCAMHYRRWWLHGDVNAVLGTPPGEATKYLREVVLSYEGDECLTWPYATLANGYAQVRFEGRSQLVSRLACEEECGPAPTPLHEAAHSCGRGDRACVARRHLSWKTHVQNEADKVRHGTIVRGERQGNAKLTEADVVNIRKLFGALRHYEIAEIYGVTRSTISQIHTGKHWAWLEEAA